MNTLDWEIEMMDVKGGYLHSMLEEEIYMHQPDGFDDGSGRVLKLQWALYGLKQLGRTWHQCLHRLLLGLRNALAYTPSPSFIRMPSWHSMWK